MTAKIMVNQFWIVDEEYDFTALDTRIYFLIVDISLHENSQDFQIKNSLICIFAECSDYELRCSREKLMDAGLIKYEYSYSKRTGVYKINNLFEGEELLNPYAFDKFLDDEEIF